MSMSLFRVDLAEMNISAVDVGHCNRTLGRSEHGPLRYSFWLPTKPQLTRRHVDYRISVVEMLDLFESCRTFNTNFQCQFWRRSILSMNNCRVLVWILDGQRPPPPEVTVQPFIVVTAVIRRFVRPVWWIVFLCIRCRFCILPLFSLRCLALDSIVSTFWPNIRIFI
jgi:hypothetical protein